MAETSATIKALAAQLHAARQSGTTLRDRLFAKNASRPKPATCHLDDMHALTERIARRGAADFASYQAAHPELADDDDQIKPQPRRRRRQLNAATIVKRLRKAGERGPVRVELPNGIVITSAMAVDPEVTADDAAEKLWLDRVAKHAH
ncbi:hypothetical protein [Bradyrhizobium sp. SZCCHNS3051]|uniref:hypothetical protein n=1 Tax=Bradyrhizobium sp. SZCCHNS3051 TaxID=3057320 RepID=UPI002916CA4D|nr:hypothetical protein [Bradyrhizobium sp. SZCCHNS3051]